MVKKEDKSKIKSIRLSMYYNEHIKDLVDIIVPIESISILRVGHIYKDLEYLKNGEYDEFTECESFETKINKNDISKKDRDILLDNITIYSVGILLDNGELTNYNMPWSSDDGICNKLQKIHSDRNSIVIVFDSKIK